MFSIDIDQEHKREICVNYLEGLEWTFKYYIDKCVDWRWSYHYHYPPLWKDLLQFIPYCDTIMIEENDRKPVHPNVQLAYVLPKTSLKYLPTNIYEQLIMKKESYYQDDCEIKWSFCKYFWEAHVELPHIDIEDLEDLCVYE